MVIGFVLNWPGSGCPLQKFRDKKKEGNAAGEASSGEPNVANNSGEHQCLKGLRGRCAKSPF